MADKAFTVSEAAQALGHHPETVRRWIRTGKIPAIKIGLSIRIAADVVHAVREGRPLPQQVVS